MSFLRSITTKHTTDDSIKSRNAMAGVVKIGYLKKNKNMRKRFFVLREDTANGPACLEYYESEKKWRNNASPKKIIVLNTCFTIDKRVDSRNKKNLICLYTKENYFYIVFDSDKELDEWLDLMLVLQRVINKPGENKELFEHIWHISILKKELGTNANLLDMTGLCLGDKKVTIMKYPTRSKKQKTIDIMLSSIRRCGALDTYFYMEVGQSSPLGAGHIWMDTWNAEVAKSVHETIIGASSRSHDPRFRMRSSSFNEGSRLINYPSRQHSSFYNEKYPGLWDRNNSSSTLNNGNVDLARAGSVKKRFDGIPFRPRTISENATSSTRSFNETLSPKQTFHKGCNCVSSNASTSMYDSGMDASSRYIDTADGVASFYLNLNDQRSAILEGKKKEEDSVRQANYSNVNNRSNSSSQTGSCYGSNNPYGSPINIDDSSNTHLNSSGVSAIPSTPDGYLPMKPGFTTVWNNNILMKGHRNSKQDLADMLRMALKLPEDYVPMAPLGSTSDYVSMDYKQGSIESGTPSTDSRFSNIHLDKVCAYLTPSEDDEGPIEKPTRAYSVGSRPDGLREKIDKINADRVRTRAFSVGSRGRLPFTRLSRYGYQSGSTSMSEQSDSGDHMEIDFSCNSKARRHYSETCRALTAQTSADLLPRSSSKLCSSPDVSCTRRSHTGSCYGSNNPYGSPINIDDSSNTHLNSSGVSAMSLPPDGYLPMKPGFTSVWNNNISMKGHRNSKQEVAHMFQREFKLPEDYVPMAPMGGIGDYVSMDYKQGSIESGTPSTDSRFSNIHLDKVCAYITPSKDDEEPIEKPTRTYSVGSKPDGLREKIDKINADRVRARAFSVGSRGRLPPMGFPRYGYQSGSTSMPKQSDSGDRMEIDFSCNSKSQQHYSETCDPLSVQTSADLLPISSPKLDSSSGLLCTQTLTGSSPPKSIDASIDINRTLSGDVHGISRSTPS